MAMKEDGDNGPVAENTNAEVQEPTPTEFPPQDLQEQGGDLNQENLEEEGEGLEAADLNGNEDASQFVFKGTRKGHKDRLKKSVKKFIEDINDIHKSKSCSSDKHTSDHHSSHHSSGSDKKKFECKCREVSSGSDHSKKSKHSSSNFETTDEDGKHIKVPCHKKDIQDQRCCNEACDWRGLKTLKLKDQLKCIPKCYRRGIVHNDVDVCRRQQQLERVKIPDRYTTTIGVENKWRNDLTRAKNKSNAIKKKTFDISGQICITEKSTGYAKEKNFQANDASGKTWNENVALVGDHCYRPKCRKCKPCKCKGGKDSSSDHSDYYYDYSDRDECFDPSCATAAATIEGAQTADTSATEQSLEGAGQGSGSTPTPPAEAEAEAPTPAEEATGETA